MVPGGLEEAEIERCKQYEEMAARASPSRGRATDTNPEPN
jgi:hypothetical protein